MRRLLRISDVNLTDDENTLMITIGVVGRKQYKLIQLNDMKDKTKQSSSL